MKKELGAEPAREDVLEAFAKTAESKKMQKTFDEFSENTVSNFYLPYGIVPNVLINGEVYCVPMVIEESSVVAACAKSAKFWLSRGGFQTEVVSTKKVGQVHFIWHGPKDLLKSFFKIIVPQLRESVSS